MLTTLFGSVPIIYSLQGADVRLLCRDAAMAPMRRAVKGKTPKEIMAMRAKLTQGYKVDMVCFRTSLDRMRSSSSPQVGLLAHSILNILNKIHTFKRNSFSHSCISAPPKIISEFSILQQKFRMSNYLRNGTHSTAQIRYSIWRPAAKNKLATWTIMNFKKGFFNAVRV